MLIATEGEGVADAAAAGSSADWVLEEEEER